MLPRERVIAVLRREKPDRIPIQGWLGNLEEGIEERFGSMSAFRDRYEFDYSGVGRGPYPWWRDPLEELKEREEPLTPADMAAVPLSDPNEEEAYENIVRGIQHHKEQRGRFVSATVYGIFEIINGIFGIENHLMYLALYPDELRELYRRQAEWNRTCAHNMLDLGVDMVHISDDWGGQSGPMFSPETWRRLIYPYHKITADAVKERGAWLSLHSDGNVRPLVDGIVELGYDVFHPWQESAGMDLEDFKENYSDRLVVMGGIDVQTTIGFGDYEKLERDIERVVRMFSDGALLLCTSHAVQEHCSIDELVFAYDTIYRLIREQAEG